MAKVFLDANETYNVNSDSDVFGNIGSETLRLDGSNIDVMSTVERIEFSDTLDAYTFSISGNVVSVFSGATTVANIVVPDTATGQKLAFADGSASLIITGLNQATLGGVAIPTTKGSVDAPLNASDESGLVVDGNIFTLKESVVEGEAPVEGTKVVYWGYNPHGHDEHGALDNEAGGNTSNKTNEGPEDGGIPVAELVKFLTTITGLDLAELGLIDANGVDPFQNVTSLTLSNPLSPTNSNSGDANGNGTNDQSTNLQVNFADGSFINAEVALGDEYFNFLNNLLFDAEGNSRLFEKEVGGSSGTSDSLEPIVLTPSRNNGGTIESGFTTTSDDTIVAGRLELLHQAYIDGGAGYNTLEIDAKGTYAQPLQLLNIQEVRVNDLPNWYTTAYGDGDGYLENTEFNSNWLPDPTGTGSDNSWIDLNRATSIEKLVVTDQGVGGSGESYSGDLTIVGVRNGATLRLEGGFQSGSTTIQYGQGQTGTLNVELALGDVTSDINILQNSAVLNVDSQGVENHMHSFFAGGSVSRMIVKGAAAFGVDEDLQASFNGGRPAIIDASANTGGLDVTLNDHYNVTVKGTQADDEIYSNGPVTVPYGQSYSNPVETAMGIVNIDAFGGNNNIQADSRTTVKINTLAGDDTISSKGSTKVTITAGDGINSINTDDSATVSITTGVGNDTISSKNGKSVTIVAGDGKNSINADIAASHANFGLSTIDITTGTGNDTISAVRANTVTIDAGSGNNTITVSANEITITTGSGSDKLYISGMDTQFDFGDQGDTVTSANNGFNDDNYVDNDHFVDNNAPGALLTLDLGAGTNTITLGRDVTDLDSSSDVDVQFGITALEGSVINGTGIKFFVENHSDLTEADLTGATITSVVLKQELRITADQFSAIGADAFSVFRDEEGATEDLYIVVSEDTTLSELVNLSELSTNVRLHFELHNGAELTLTAEELHKYVSWHGIDSTDGLNGKVKIIDAGQNFDPFDNGNNYQVIDGGSLTDTFDASTDVTIIRKLDGGFERPAPLPSTDVLLLDSNVDDSITTAIVSEVSTLKIVGDKDIAFAHTVDLGRDAAAALLADGVSRGDLVAPETDAFTIDFSALNGNVINLTVANFQDVKEIKGNGNGARDVRLDVELTNGSTVGAAGNGNGLKSSGVQTYVVTAIGDDSVGEDAAASSATFYVCDLSADVTTLGLQGNYNDTINFLQVNWGTNFLLEGGGTAKADGNPSFANIGNLHAEYFWSGAEPHAAAVVDIVNLDADDSLRPVNVAGIDIDNADSITVNVAGDTDVVIQSMSGNSLENLVFLADGDVTLRGDLAAANIDADEFIRVFDASEVDGVFTLELSTAAATDLSKAEVTGIDKVVFANNGAVLTLDVAQALDIEAANFSSAAGITGAVINFENLGGEEINMPAFSANIGTVSIVDADGTVTLHPNTVLGNALNAADSLLIKSSLDDTTVEMTAVQFNQLLGNGTVTSINGTDTSTGKAFVSTLVVTDLAPATELNFSAVDQSTATTPESNVKVVVLAEDVVATSAMSITGGTNVTLEVAGTVDLTKAGALTGITAVKLDEGSVLTLTAAQVIAITLADTTPADGIADNWSGLAGAKLNITEVSNGFNLDLTLLEKAGIDIGTLTLADSNGSITLGANANLANADAIITPTKDVNDTVDGIEPTTLTLTAAQFNQLEGIGTISGDATVNITDLVNNFDHEGDFVLDAAVINVSNITAKHGYVTLGAATVTLDAESSSLAGFEIRLDDGQMIRFTTEVQANGAIIKEIDGTDADATADPTAVAWLFTSVTGVIDTSKYDSAINHLFISEELIDSLPGNQNEESLWTTLAESIVVEKFNAADIPDVLIGFDRVNTFEALTAIDGVSYDDQNQFESVANLTINLEGNTSIGNVGIGDTVIPTDGTVIFDSLVINSYEDRSTLSNDNGFAFQPNKVGNIGLNAGSTDELVNVTLNTYANVDNIIGTADDATGFFDAINVNAAAAERDGLELEVGTITFAANPNVPASDTTAHLTLTGANDITIAAVDISDTEVSLLDINATAFTGDLVIGAIAPVNGINDFEHIYVVDGHTSPVTEVMGTVANDDLLVVAGGANDLTQITTPANFDIDAVHFTQDGSLTLTAAQVALIGTIDGPDADEIADAWSTIAALNVTLNITEVDSTSAAMDLAKVAAAGINIGTITIKDTNATVTINTATTMGDADKIIVPAGTVLNLTAKQFDELQGTGTIEGLTATGQDKGAVNITNLKNTIDSNDAGTTTTDKADYTFLDVTLVTATHGTITLDPAVTDVSVGNLADNVHSILGNFSIVLNDVDSTATANELAGQTIRFSTALQAERVITVTGSDPAVPLTPVAGDPERDTNVIWLFNTISGTAVTGKIDTDGYSADLGRVWVNSALVNGQNVEDIFSAYDSITATQTEDVFNLNGSTIIRVVNQADLATLLPENHSLDRYVEVEAFTQLPGGLIFSNPDKLVDVENLTIDFGGAVDMGALTLDNIILPSTLNGDEFGTLTINSKLAGSDSVAGAPNDHLQDAYLLPENFNPAVNVYPDGLPAAEQVNTIGAISSGANRGELARVTINATGIGLNTGTLTFSDDFTDVPATVPVAEADPTAVLTVTGSQNINIASVVASDVDITAVSVVSGGYTGVLTAPGASPGFKLDDSTAALPNLATQNVETLSFSSTAGALNVYDDLTTPASEFVNNGGVITLGSATHAGVVGNDLSFIDSTTFLGELNLGTLASIDNTNENRNGDADATDATDYAFNMTTGAGKTTATLAALEGYTPTLLAHNDWKFDYTSVFTTGGLAYAQSRLVLTDTAVLQQFSTLHLVNVPLEIQGNVVLTQMIDDPTTVGITEGLDITGGYIFVPSGNTLTLTVAQALALTVDIVGEGTVILTGAATNADPTVLGQHLRVANVNLSAVTIDLVTDLDDQLDYFLPIAGTVQDDLVTLAGQNVIGSLNDDVIFSFAAFDDTITGLAGNDVHDVFPGDDTHIVDAGTDTITSLITGDTLKVSSGATANAFQLDGSIFTATAATTNAGTANITGADDVDSTLDLTLAGGPNGYNLNGGLGDTLGNDILVGSAFADHLNGGNDNQTATTAVDTLTGRAGADVFEFNVNVNSAATLTVATTTAAIDREQVTFTADAVDNDDETMTINYTVNGVPGSVAVDLGGLGLVDVTSATAIAAAIAPLVDGEAGISASAAAGVLTVVGDNGAAVTITAATPGGTTDALAGAIANGTDVAQVTTLTVAGTPTPGDTYSLLADLAVGVGTNASYVALPLDTSVEVAAGLAGSFATAEITDVAALSVITFTDADADNGGFTLTTDTTAAFAGSGASDIGATALNLADIITDFTTADDSIDFSPGVAGIAGNGTNYAEVLGAADFTAARTAADAALNGTVLYYFTTSLADNTGLLFFDANLDGNVDGVVNLVGCTTLASFDSSDIIA